MAATALALAWLVASPGNLAAAPQGAAAGTAAAGAAPRMPDGHPDLSGVWWPGADVGAARGGAGGRGAAPGGARGGGRGAAPQTPPPPSFNSLYKPSAQELVKTLSDKDDPTLRCIPVAFGTLNARMFSVGAVAQIVQSPKFLVMLTETYHGFQIIPTDGRAHRDDVPPAYRGDSVGHWEGDTLVVDTTNFTDSTWMFAEGRVSPHSDALHIVERYRRTDAKTLEVEATIEDPQMLTGPWQAPKQILQLAPFDEIMSLNCSGIETQSLMNAAAKQNYGKK
jgi:hypothetical protein